MRVLHLIPCLSGGGAERQLSYLAAEHARLGYSIHVIYCQEGPSKPQLPGVFLHKLKATSNYDPSLLVQLTLLTLKIKPNVIQSWILQMDILGAIVSIICRVPWILREPSASENYSDSFKNTMRIYFAKNYAKFIIANSFGGQRYWNTLGVHNKVKVIRNGVPLSEISLAFNVPSNLSNENKLHLSLLYVGRLSAEGSANKNLVPLLMAFKNVKEKLNSDVHLFLCGEGPEKASLESEVLKLNIKSNVHFMGHIPPAEVWGLMKRATLFISLSAYEGCPNSVVEAIACKTPLILSDIPAHNEILNRHEAIFVDPLNIDNVAQKIIELLKDEVLRYDLSRGLYERIKEWSIESMAESYANIYSDILGKKY